MKTLKCEAVAGFEEKNDALVTVRPAASGVTVHLRSKVQKQYGKHIESLVADLVAQQGYDGVEVEVLDLAAWDYTIRARVISALERGSR